MEAMVFLNTLAALLLLLGFLVFAVPDEDEPGNSLDQQTP